MRNGHPTSVNLSFGLEYKLEIFGSNRGLGEWIISACVFPTVKHG